MKKREVAKIENIVCKVDGGKELLYEKDNGLEITESYEMEGALKYKSEYWGLGLQVRYVARKFPITNWMLKCTCSRNYHRSYACANWGKDSKGEDIFVCEECGKRFFPCDFCYKKPYSQGEREFFNDCEGCATRKLHNKEVEEKRFEQNKRNREIEIKAGRMSEIEGSRDNLLERMNIDERKILKKSLSGSKIAFGHTTFGDHFGYKSISQDVIIYSIYPKIQILAEAGHLTGLGCVSTKRYYIGDLETISVESILSTRSEYPLVEFNEDETEITISWFDGEKQTEKFL